MTDREALIKAFLARKKEHDELEEKVKSCIFNILIYFREITKP